MAKFIGLMIIASFPLLVLNLTGFCYLQMRYLSNQELFEAAISHEAYRIGDYLPKDTPRSYLATHPNCCSIPGSRPMLPASQSPPSCHRLCRRCWIRQGGPSPSHCSTSLA